MLQTAQWSWGERLGMVLSDASDILQNRKEAPTLVHLVAMSVDKDAPALSNTPQEPQSNLSVTH